MIKIPMNNIIFLWRVFMAKGPGIVPYLGTGGRGRPSAFTPRSITVPRNNNNFECPQCHTKLDRHRDVRIWIDKKRRYGECPFCHKKVVFIQIKRPGPVLGSAYIPVVDDYQFSLMIEFVKTMRNPCKFLAITDLMEITGMDRPFITQQRARLGYKNHRGRRNQLDEMKRLAVYYLIQLEGYEPPDLRYFKDQFKMHK